MFDRLKRAYKAFTAAPTKGGQRLGEYNGALVDRLQNFVVGLRSEDQEIKSNIMRLRAHSRDLVRNNPYMRRFVKLCGQQVVGDKGITMQANVMVGDKKPKTTANDAIEAAWREWCRPGTCTVDGKHSWVDVQLHSVRGAARDGEAFWRKIRGAKAGNRFGFALQYLDPDQLDLGLQVPGAPGTNAVVMGVEMDDTGKPVAFHFWTAHPSDPVTSRKRIRIPAGDIVHFYDPNRASQSRGIPWSVSSMWLLSMLGAYWEAEVAAARADAERLGFLYNELGDADAPPAKTGDATDPQPVNLPSEVASWYEVPAGWRAEQPEARHPNSGFPEFSKAMLKGISTGLGVSYHSLTGDLSDANYSSLRQGALDEHDGWREAQRLLIEHLCQPIFSEWLDLAVMSGALQLAARDMEQARSPKWEPRGWDWVDPLKDAKSDIMSIEAGLDTRTRVLRERGLNFEEVIRELAQEQALAQELGVDLSVVKSPDVSAEDVTSDNTSSKKGGKGGKTASSAA